MIWRPATNHCYLDGKCDCYFCLLNINSEFVNSKNLKHQPNNSSCILPIYYKKSNNVDNSNSKIDSNPISIPISVPILNEITLDGNNLDYVMEDNSSTFNQTNEQQYAPKENRLNSDKYLMMKLREDVNYISNQVVETRQDINYLYTEQQKLNEIMNKMVEKMDKVDESYELINQLQQTMNIFTFVYLATCNNNIGNSTNYNIFNDNLNNYNENLQSSNDFLNFNPINNSTATHTPKKKTQKKSSAKNTNQPLNLSNK